MLLVHLMVRPFEPLYTESYDQIGKPIDEGII
jgi:hypothetical protein